MRIISDNAADRATLTAANTAAGLGADLLKTDIKGNACRVLASSASIVATWTANEAVGAVVIPASNLQAAATIRVRAYSDTAGTTLLHDTGAKLAAPGQTPPASASQFAFELPPITAIYLPVLANVRRLVIDITNGTATFIDISRLVIGNYFEPKYSAAFGQTDGIIDMSTHSRTASGDLKTDIGPLARRMTFSLSWIATVDRAKVRQLLEKGIKQWLFISLMPGDSDPARERDKSIYGKAKAPGMLTWSSAVLHAASFEIEGY